MNTHQPIAIVTGGGRNIGKTIALRLARDGYDLVLAGPEPGHLEATAEEIRALKRKCVPLVTDIRHEAQVHAMAEKSLGAFGHVDVLVNNAGISGPTALVSQISRADWDDVLAVNLTGAFLCSKAVLPSMMARRSGKIVNISSMAGKIGYGLRSPYAVSKWGLIGLTLTLAKEVGAYSIQVNAVCPGPVEGERIRSVIRGRAAELGQTEEEVHDWYVRQMVLGRLVQPEDVAALVAFLASPQGNNITGQAIDVSAGYGI
jgi:NAD(P)-dependent dehydrogenase (short-subunit alcohol dehydrogenase family)